MKLKLACISIAIFCSSILYAQTKSEVIETINNSKYYIHTVQPKETFYGISRLYGVSIDEIQYCNDNLKSLTIGQQIRIPYSEPKVETSQQQYKSGEIISQNGQLLIVHTVQPSETIYAIARLYQVSAGQILGVNPALVTNTSLSIGQQIFVPTTEEKYKEIQKIHEQSQINFQYNPATTYATMGDSTTTDSTNALEPLYVHPSIDISMLLPFYLDKNASQGDADIINKPQQIYEHTYQFLEYYEGVLMALDTLKAMGISITLHVIESNNDSASANINKISTHTDLIIGPVFPKTFPAAAAFAKRHTIPIISPLSSEETNVTNPYVIHMNTPQKYRFKAMVQQILATTQNCHVCIVYNNEALEKKSVTQCKSAFAEQKSALEAKHISYEELYYPTVGSAGLDKALSKKEKSIVVVLSKQQAFANNIVTKLYQSSKKHNIDVWGLPQWETYENLELDFLFDLNFKLVTNSEIDYTSPAVNRFIKAYRDKYRGEPTKFSFLGYDQMLFFAKHYATSSDFMADLQTVENTKGLVENFQFLKKDGATTNTSSYIVEYDKSTFTRKTTLSTK